MQEKFMLETRESMRINQMKQRRPMLILQNRQYLQTRPLLRLRSGGSAMRIKRKKRGRRRRNKSIYLQITSVTLQLSSSGQKGDADEISFCMFMCIPDEIDMMKLYT
mmetsp:Transcript_19886/g.42856  ORF Transcript_19886/g.42856 Transcript_19886/m.42856 type:complete len:107 (+) Transcript_19886:562-882(+)